MGSQKDAAGGSAVSGFLHRLGLAGMLHPPTSQGIATLQILARADVDFHHKVLHLWLQALHDGSATS